MVNENETRNEPIAATAPVDGTYQIESNEEGIFLTVHPPQNGGIPVKEPDIINDLKNRHLTGFKNELILAAIKDASGTMVKIGEKATESVEPEIQVLVDRDRMSAALSVTLFRNSPPVTIEEVLDKIQKAGVVFGIDNESVKRALETPGVRVICARGESPVDGSDACIKHFFDQSKRGQPLELTDGRVDFKDLNLYTVVQEGDILAEKIAATPGTPGTDVLGQPAYAKPGKDIVMPVGKNVIARGNQIVAAIAGQLQLVNNKFNVSPVIEVKADVDLSTGNIDFVGNVIVRGSVTTGFMVKAQGNVEIYGTVSGGIVEGKNVIIRRGIQGMQRGYIKSKENVATTFIENATVSAEGDIIVTDTILHSQINAGKKVIVEGRRGFIAGGHVMAAEEIRAKTVGTHLAVATDLEVGVDPELRNEYNNLRKELKKIEASLDQTRKSVGILKGVSQVDLPPDKKELLLKLTKAQFQLTGQVDTMQRRLEELELIFEETRYGRIRVSETVFPGVKIVIGTLIKPIREQVKFVSYFAENGEITTGSFK